ncbi:hypothetical protein Tco_1355591 [Tanacetum coccineum]
MNLVRQVAMGSQLRLRFKKEARLLDQEIQVRDEEMKKLDQEIQSLLVVESEVHGLRNQTQNLETLLEAEVDMKKAVEAKNAELTNDLESLCVQFLNLQVNNNQLSQQVSHLQAQVTGEERIKAAFKEFKKYKDNNFKKRCRRWVIGHGLRLAVMKCTESSEIRQAFANVVSAGLAKGMSEGLKYGIEHEKAGRDLADVEAYDPEANNKLVKALQDLKDLKYPMSDTGEDAPQWICDLRPSSSQLKIPIYLRSDGIPVSVPTVGPQGLAILLTDAGTQTQRSEDEASLRLFRSKSLPPMYNLDWP